MYRGNQKNLHGASPFAGVKGRFDDYKEEGTDANIWRKLTKIVRNINVLVFYSASAIYGLSGRQRKEAVGPSFRRQPVPFGRHRFVTWQDAKPAARGSYLAIAVTAMSDFFTDLGLVPSVRLT